MHGEWATGNDLRRCPASHVDERALTLDEATLWGCDRRCHTVGAGYRNHLGIRVNRHRGFDMTVDLLNLRRIIRRRDRADLGKPNHSASVNHAWCHRHARGVDDLRVVWDPHFLTYRRNPATLDNDGPALNWCTRHCEDPSTDDGDRNRIGCQHRFGHVSVTGRHQFSTYRWRKRWRRPFSDSIIRVLNILLDVALTADLGRVES